MKQKTHLIVRIADQDFITACGRRLRGVHKGNGTAYIGATTCEKCLEKKLKISLNDREGTWEWPLTCD